MVDVHEPDEIFRLLKQSVPHVERASLNGEGKNMPDYAWLNWENKFEGVERKHWTEILPSIDKVEQQLDSQRFTVEAHSLLIEDLLIPQDSGGVVTYTSLQDASRKNSRGSYLKSKRGWGNRQPHYLHRIYSWLYKLQRSGVEVWHSANMVVTATIISMMYNRSQMAPEQHYAFQEYYRVKAPRQYRNPAMLAVMGLAKGIGPAMAKKLLDEYGTIYSIATASKRDLTTTVGSRGAGIILDALGRVE